jgi:hypothetical protein
MGSSSGASHYSDLMQRSPLRHGSNDNTEDRLGWRLAQPLGSCSISTRLAIWSRIGCVADRALEMGAQRDAARCESANARAWR